MRAIAVIILFLLPFAISAQEEPEVARKKVVDERKEGKADSNGLYNAPVSNITGGIKDYFIPAYSRNKYSLSHYSFNGHLNTIAFVEKEDGYQILDNLYINGSQIVNESFVTITETDVIDETRHKTLLKMPPSKWVNVTNGDIEKCESIFFQDDSGARGIEVLRQVYFGSGPLEGKLVDEATIKEYYVLGKGMIKAVHASTNGVFRKLARQTFLGKHEGATAQSIKEEIDINGNHTTDVKDAARTMVEQSPEFPGGTDGLSRFIGENLKYPPNARRLGIEGSVFVSFVVDESGAISDIAIVKAISPDCDTEAIRVIRIMPHWKPGEQGGNIVSSRVELRVKFKLSQ